ncbi:MAG TPA: hypothetical protein PKY28_06425, partial [Ferruginibacter sp.]|nr:hypothetical protein [Ferruginibacter sp.]
MKKSIFAIAGCIFFAWSCTKQTETIPDERIDDPALETPVAGNRCAAEEVLAQQLLADPGLAARMQAIEDVTARYVKNPGNYFISNGNVVIPVVVNVLYKTAAQNISQAQIQSQIDVLN